MTNSTIRFAAVQTSSAGLLLQASLAAVAFIVLAGLSVKQHHVMPICFGVIIVLGVCLMLWLRRREMRRSIDVCPDEKTITFRDFVVVNSFWPQPSTPEETVHFSDVLKSKVYPSGKGIETLRIVLTAGRIDVREDTMQNYDALRELISRVVSANEGSQQPLAQVQQ